MGTQSIIHKTVENLKDQSNCIYTEIAKQFLLKFDYKIDSEYCYDDFYFIEKLTDLLNDVSEKLNILQCKYDVECYTCDTPTKTQPPTAICIAPTVENNFIVYEGIHVFDIDSFTKGFTDISGSSYDKVRIITLPEKGQLVFNNFLVIPNQEIDLNDIGLLTYSLEQENPSTIGSIISFIFQTSSNDIECNLYSNMAVFTINSEAYVNQSPSIGDNTISVPNRSTTTLTTAMFTSGTTPPYNDIEGDSPLNIRIDSLNTDGQLLFNNVPVTVGQQMSFSNLSSGFLTFVSPNQDPLDVDSFTFSISDTGSGLYSTTSGTFTINSGVYINQDPTIGDNSITVDNRSTTTLTTEMFTSGTTPPYSDPENDPLLEIRIDSLNIDGQLLLNGVPVVVNQIIPISDITSNLLTFVAPNQDTVDTDTFTWSGRDSINGTFIS